MKIILLIAGFFLTAFISYGQSDTALKYSEVISIDSVSKDALFQKARSWLNDAFKSSKDVIQIQDKET